VPGGGTALLKASQALANLEGANDDQTAGIAIVRRALQSPIRQIAENAGVEGSVVVNAVLADKSPNFGFNAQTEKYVDLVADGVIDPAKVVRTALQDAASAAWAAWISDPALSFADYGRAGRKARSFFFFSSPSCYDGEVAARAVASSAAKMTEGSLAGVQAASASVSDPSVADFVLRTAPRHLPISTKWGGD